MGGTRMVRWGRARWGTARVGRARVVGAVTVTVVLAAGCTGGTGGGGKAAATSAAPRSSSTTSPDEERAEHETSVPGAEQQLTASMASYRGYLLGVASTLNNTATQLVAALRGGDLPRAKQQYLAGRLLWGQLRPAVGQLSGVSAQLDSLPGDHPSASDAAFTGWHRVERELWATGDVAAARSAAQRLQTDLAALATRLRTEKLTPPAVVSGARSLVETLRSRALAGTEEPYSHSDLADVAAGVDGVQVVFRVLTPFAQGENPTVVAALQRDLAAASTAVVALRGAGGYPAVATVKASARDDLGARLDTVRGSLLRLTALPGLH